MNKCKECKYFKRNTSEYYSDKYGACICNKFIYGYSKDERELNLNDKLFYMDCEWYDAFFEVGENFGCIHWRKK